MQLAPVVAHLKTIPQFAGRVFAARDMDTAIEKARITAVGAPRCVLFAPRELAGGNSSRIGRRVVQDVTVRFGVMICVRYAGDAELAFDELDALRDGVVALLLGWMGIADHQPIELSSGQLVFSDVGLVVWADEFRTSYTVRTNS